LKRYWDRATDLEEFSLYRLNLTHKFDNGQWKQSTKENIIRIWPRPSSLREGPQWEEYCRVKVILHVRHRNIQELNEDGTVTWTTLYERYKVEINNDPNDALGEPVDKEEDEITDEEDDLEVPEDDYEEEFRADWMVLAEMGPNANIKQSSELGTRDMDKNHDWINEDKQYYDNSELMEANTFLERVSKNEGIEVDEDNVDYTTLNEKQKQIFKRIESHYLNMNAGHQVEPLKIMIMGTAGTGKSYLIKSI